MFLITRLGIKQAISNMAHTQPLAYPKAENGLV